MSRAAHARDCNGDFGARLQRVIRLESGSQRAITKALDLFQEGLVCTWVVVFRVLQSTEGNFIFCFGVPTHVGGRRGKYRFL